MFELNLSQMNAIAGGKGAPSGFKTEEMDHSIMRSMGAMSAESDDYDGDYDGGDNPDEDSTPTDEGGDHDGGGGSGDDGTREVVIIGHSMTEAEKEEYDRKQRELEESLRREAQLQFEILRLQNELILKGLEDARIAAEEKAKKDAEDEKKKDFEDTKKACEDAMHKGGETAVRALITDYKIGEFFAYQAGRLYAANNDASCIKFKQLNEAKNP